MTVDCQPGCAVKQMPTMLHNMRAPQLEGTHLTAPARQMQSTPKLQCTTNCNSSATFTTVNMCGVQLQPSPIGRPARRLWPPVMCNCHVLAAAVAVIPQPHHHAQFQGQLCSSRTALSIRQHRQPGTGTCRTHSQHAAMGLSKGILPRGCSNRDHDSTLNQQTKPITYMSHYGITAASLVPAGYLKECPAA